MHTNSYKMGLDYTKIGYIQFTDSARALQRNPYFDSLLKNI